jgi:hypothetical protein
MVDANQQNTQAGEVSFDVGDHDNNEVMTEAQGKYEKNPLSDRENGGAVGENDRGDADRQPTVSAHAHNTATEGENERDTTPSSRANPLANTQNDQEDSESQIEFDVELGSALKSSERLKGRNFRSVSFDSSSDDELELSEKHDSVGSLPPIRSRPSLSDFAATNRSTRTLIQHNQRLSLTVDLETGKEGGSRAQCAMVSICYPSSMMSCLKMLHALNQIHLIFRFDSQRSVMLNAVDAAT